jgi:hypothetical protein
MCRYANVRSDTPTEQLARAVAARGQVDPDWLLAILRRCVAVLAGEQLSPDELVRLVTEVREAESKLKL